MWLKIIGSFLASIFGSFWHDRSVRKAEDEKVAGHEAEQTVNRIIRVCWERGWRPEEKAA